LGNFTTTKSLTAAAFGLALALLTLRPPARAQVAAQQQPPAQRQTQPVPAARRAARPRAGNLVRQLNLSRAQRLQLRDIRRRREPEARELVRRVRLARRALDEAIYSDAAEDSLVEQRAGELAAAQSALVRLRAATELKVRRVLTAEQLQTFRELRLQAQRRQLLQRRRADPDSRGAPADPAPESDDPPQR
jgi:Spy/CpxP family protein refolding chaperone